MIKRIVDISEPAYLHVKHGQLMVEKGGEIVANIAIEDLGILILENPAIVYTQSVITHCQQHNVAVVFCDQRHLPISIVLPLWGGNSLHTKVLREQVALSEPRRKSLWQQIVKHKIAEQALTIEQAGRSAKGLRRLEGKVRSGDPDNCESQAARQYWPMLMGPAFRRNPDQEGHNSLLNYGYAVVRAMVARALVGTGLHPAIGLHHRNQYNGLCLADDVMEPFRPWVDWLIYSTFDTQSQLVVDRQAKQLLLGMLAEDVLYDDKKMPFMVAVHLLAARLKQSLSNKQKLVYPKRLNC